MRTIFEMWSSIADYIILICVLVSLLSTFIWSVFNVERKRMLTYSVCFICAIAVLFLPYYYFWLLMSFHLIGIRLQLLCPLMLLATAIFVIGNVKGKQIIAGVSYLFNLLFLLMGLEALKSAGGTSGNSNLDFGLYVVFNALLILQVLTYLYESNLFYGLLKLFFGVASALISTPTKLV